MEHKFYDSQRNKRKPYIYFFLTYQKAFLIQSSEKNDWISKLGTRWESVAVYADVVSQVRRDGESRTQI